MVRLHARLTRLNPGATSGAGEARVEQVPPPPPLGPPPRGTTTLYSEASSGAGATRVAQVPPPPPPSPRTFVTTDDSGSSPACPSCSHSDACGRQYPCGQGHVPTPTSLHVSGHSSTSQLVAGTDGRSKTSSAPSCPLSKLHNRSLRERIVTTFASKHIGYAEELWLPRPHGLGKDTLATRTAEYMEAHPAAEVRTGNAVQAESSATRTRMVDSWKTWHTRGFPFEPSVCVLGSFMQSIMALIAYLCSVPSAHSSRAAQIRVRPRITTDPTYRSLPRTARDVVYTTLLSRNQCTYALKLFMLATMVTGVSGSSPDHNICFANSTANTGLIGLGPPTSGVYNFAMDIYLLVVQLLVIAAVTVRVLAVTHTGTICTVVGYHAYTRCSLVSRAGTLALMHAGAFANQFLTAAVWFGAWCFRSDAGVSLVASCATVMLSADVHRITHQAVVQLLVLLPTQWTRTQTFSPCRWSSL